MLAGTELQKEQASVATATKHLPVLNCVYKKWLQSPGQEIGLFTLALALALEV